MAVTAGDGVERPTDVDVILLQTDGVGQVHHHPVAAGARQTRGGKRTHRVRRRHLMLLQRKETSLRFASYLERSYWSRVLGSVTMQE